MPDKMEIIKGSPADAKDGRCVSSVLVDHAGYWVSVISSILSVLII